MIRETEKEYKFLISKETFDEVMDKCSNKYLLLERKLQINYYYDTLNNKLNEYKITVRIRKKNNDMKLQIKKHISQQNFRIDSYEYSCNITELPPSVKIPNFKEELILKGKLITDRIIYKCGNSSIVCLDKNTYLGTTDYEVEIEVTEDEEIYILKDIEYLCLEGMGVQSKSSRFFEKLKQQKSSLEGVENEN